MFNVNITDSFSGACPNSIVIATSVHRSAIHFYQVRFRAKVVQRKARSVAVLESTYGFLICVDRSSAPRAQNVRLSLHPSADRTKLAKDLGAGAKVRSSRNGLNVTDPYGVTWTIA